MLTLCFYFVSAYGDSRDIINQPKLYRKIKHESPLAPLDDQGAAATIGVGVVISVSTQSELIAAIENGNSIALTQDILLISSGIEARSATGITIKGIKGLTINGNGFKLDGQNSVRCIYIDKSNVSFMHLNVTGGIQVTLSVLIIYIECICRVGIYFHDHHGS